LPPYFPMSSWSESALTATSTKIRYRRRLARTRPIKSTKALRLTNGALQCRAQTGSRKRSNNRYKRRRNAARRMSSASSKGENAFAKRISNEDARRMPSARKKNE
jgi:hypothetical protein